MKLPSIACCDNKWYDMSDSNVKPAYEQSTTSYPQSDQYISICKATRTRLIVYLHYVYFCYQKKSKIMSALYFCKHLRFVILKYI